MFGKGFLKGEQRAYLGQPFVSTPATAPHTSLSLPVEVIGVVGEQLAKLQYWGTLANLNVSCKAVRWETTPILWKVFRQSEFTSTSDGRLLTINEYEERFMATLAHNDGYKCIQ